MDNILLSEKYSPKEYKDLTHSVKTNKLLEKLSKTKWNEGLPNMIIYGNRGSGKYTRTILLLKSFFKKNIDFKPKFLDVNTSKIYPLSYYKNKIKSKVIFIKSNNYYFEIDLSQPNAGDALTNFISSFSKTKNIYNKIHKYLLLKNFHFLNKKYQCSLRRTIELYSHNIRFIIITSKYSCVMSALKSRLIPIKVSSPDEKEAIQIITKIQTSENIVIDNKIKYNIINKSKIGSSGIIHLKEMFLILECSILLSKKNNILHIEYEGDVTQIYQSERNKAVEDLLKNVRRKDIENIRTTLQKINIYLKDYFSEIVTCDLFRKLYPFIQNKQKFIERTAYWNSVISRDYIQYHILQAEAYIFEIINLI